MEGHFRRKLPETRASDAQSLNTTQMVRQTRNSARRRMMQLIRLALVAAQAKRARLRQIEELRKAQELKHTLTPRASTVGM